MSFILWICNVRVRLALPILLASVSTLFAMDWDEDKQCDVLSNHKVVQLQSVYCDPLGFQHVFQVGSAVSIADGAYITLASCLERSWFWDRLWTGYQLVTDSSPHALVIPVDYCECHPDCPELCSDIAVLGVRSRLSTIKTAFLLNEQDIVSDKPCTYVGYPVSSRRGSGFVRLPVGKRADISLETNAQDNEFIYSGAFPGDAGSPLSDSAVEASGFVSWGMQGGGVFDGVNLVALIQGFNIEYANIYTLWKYLLIMMQNYNAVLGWGLFFQTDWSWPGVRVRSLKLHRHREWIDQVVAEMMKQNTIQGSREDEPEYEGKDKKR